MAEEFEEYITFTVNNKDGEEVTMAVVDEFEFEHKSYIVAALVKEDTIDEEGLFIYRAIPDGDDFTVEKIKNEVDYQKIAKAYMAIEG